jgi:branched-chain amino acid transport system ATP-binding protein
VIKGMNSKETEHMLDIIKKIYDEGVTLFLLEQVMITIRLLSDRAIFLYHGEKIAKKNLFKLFKNQKVIGAYCGKRTSCAFGRGDKGTL